MNMLNAKNGKFNAMSPGGIMVGVILLIILVQVLAVVLPQFNTAGQALNATGIPLTTFFQTNGVIILAIVGAVVIGVVYYLFGRDGGLR